MFFPTSLIDILLAILIVVFIVVWIYLVVILMRLLSLMNRVDTFVSYIDRVGAVIQSFEAIPTALVSLVRQFALWFLDKGQHKTKKKSVSD